MAFSIHANFDPEISKSGIEYWDNYFKDSPWVLRDSDGYGVFTFVKPRFENGDQRFVDFMNAVREADHYLLSLTMDKMVEPSPEFITEKLKEYKFDEYINLMVIDQSPDFNKVFEDSNIRVHASDYRLEVEPLVIGLGVEDYFEGFIAQEGWKLEGKTLIDWEGDLWYCPDPGFLKKGETVCYSSYYFSFVHP